MRGNLSNEIVSIKIEEGSKRPIALHEKSFFGKIEEDTNPDSIADTLNIDIGDIHDISIAIPINVFISDQINTLGLTPPSLVREIDPPRKPYPTFFKLVASWQ